MDFLSAFLNAFFKNILSVIPSVLKHFEYLVDKDLVLMNNS